MITRTVTEQEAQNVLKNVEQIMQEQWMSLKRLAAKVYPDRIPTVGASYLSTSLRRPKMGIPLTMKFVNKISEGLQCSPEKLLAPPGELKLSIAGQAFIKEATKKGLTPESVSKITGISEEKLLSTINKGLTKFSQDEIIKLTHDRLRFSLPTLVPFAADQVDILSLANNVSLPMANEEKWIYQRKAISKIMSDQSVTIAQLGQKTGIPTEELIAEVLWSSHYDKINNISAPPLEKWQAVLAALGAAEKSEKDLMLMGKYSLNSKQLEELIGCEKIFRDYAKNYISKGVTPPQISEKDLYNFYLGMKHQWFSQVGRLTQDTIIDTIRKIGWNKFILFSAGFLTAALKTAPLSAAEIASDYAIKYYDEKESGSENNLNKMMYLVNSNLLKLLFLIPKGITAAASTNFPTESNFLSSILKLPFDMVERFIEADGHSKAIVEDWKKMFSLIMNATNIRDAKYSSREQAEFYLQQIPELKSVKNGKYEMDLLSTVYEDLPEDDCLQNVATEGKYEMDLFSYVEKLLDEEFSELNNELIPTVDLIEELKDDKQEVNTSEDTPDLSVDEQKLVEDITSLQNDKEKLMEDIASFENDEKEIDILNQQIEAEENKLKQEIQSHNQRMQACDAAIQVAITQFKANLPLVEKDIFYQLRKCNSSTIPKANIMFQQHYNNFNNVTIPSIQAAHGFPSNYIPPSNMAYNEMIKKINPLIEKNHDSLPKIQEQQKKFVEQQNKLQVQHQTFQDQQNRFQQQLLQNQFKQQQLRNQTIRSMAMDSISNNAKKFQEDQKKRDNAAKETQERSNKMFAQARDANKRDFGGKIHLAKMEIARGGKPSTGGLFSQQKSNQNSSCFPGWYPNPNMPGYCRPGPRIVGPTIKSFGKK